MHASHSVGQCAMADITDNKIRLHFFKNYWKDIHRGP